MNELKSTKHHRAEDASYLLAAILPALLLILAGVIMLGLLEFTISDPWFVLVWIASAACGLVFSVQTFRLASLGAIRTVGGFLAAVYFLGIWSLAILNK